MFAPAEDAVTRAGPFAKLFVVLAAGVSACAPAHIPDPGARSGIALPVADCPRAGMRVTDFAVPEISTYAGCLVSVRANVRIIDAVTAELTDPDSDASSHVLKARGDFTKSVPATPVIVSGTIDTSGPRPTFNDSIVTIPR